MFHYLVNHIPCCSLEPINGLQAVEPNQPPKAFLFSAPEKGRRTTFALTDPRMMGLKIEGVHWLNENELPDALELDEMTQAAFAAGGMRAVNTEYADWQSLLLPAAGKAKKRINILAMGDVGGTLLTGLRLMGSDVVESIGICDLNENAARRWEFEANQIQFPWQYDRLPPVEIITPDQLFQCDMVVFVASRGIPPVGSGVQDVRMAQFEANSAIVASYARQARKEHFQGLFCQVSDPVDPLAGVMYRTSNLDENGNWDGKGLRAEQIQGFGLGVMNARGAYYAGKQEHLADFLTEGRAFGPHGEDLVLANSIEHYDDEKSRELTGLAVHANMEMRGWGYKPYVAPALSSGAISLLLTLRGEWHYGSVCLGGIYMGCKNRLTSLGLETELLPLPEKLMGRIEAAAENLAKLV